MARDKDWYLLLGHVAKSPDPTHQGHLKLGHTRRAAHLQLPWKPKGPEAVTRSLLCPLSLSVILSSGALRLPLCPPLWYPQGWPVAGLQSWCRGTR